MRPELQPRAHTERSVVPLASEEPILLSDECPHSVLIRRFVQLKADIRSLNDAYPPNTWMGAE